MDLEGWLKKYQKMNMKTFQGIPDKHLYYEEYDKYKCKTARFNAKVQELDIRETAKELVALG